jgi:pimeloyl-ACP methyl ester carboxylesterase
MKKLLKRIGIVVVSTLTILSILLIICYINHRVQLSNEDYIFQSNGIQVDVNGHSMNVYVEGTGSQTLVFMSGGGTCSPVLDFKSLYTLLSDTYRIVVVEKAGYGFSEVTTNTARDINTVLSETREALRLAGVDGPYILCPHSMSGIEALYWAQQYPKEVSAIIGLDMSVPQSYDNYQINMTMLRLSKFAANIGLTRWIPGIANSEAIKYGTLTEEEKTLYRTVFYRRTATADMLREVQQIKASAKKVAVGSIPEVPILIFSSNGEGTGWSESAWREYQSEFIASCANGTMIELDCSHYVHDIEYKKIALDIKQYLGSIE